MSEAQYNELYAEVLAHRARIVAAEEVLLARRWCLAERILPIQIAIRITKNTKLPRCLVNMIAEYTVPSQDNLQATQACVVNARSYTGLTYISEMALVDEMIRGSFIYRPVVKRKMAVVAATPVKRNRLRT
jgi:hypothetical protein